MRLVAAVSALSAMNLALRRGIIAIYKVATIYVYKVATMVLERLWQEREGREASLIFTDTGYRNTKVEIFRNLDDKYARKTIIIIIIIITISKTRNLAPNFP